MINTGSFPKALGGKRVGSNSRGSNKRSGGSGRIPNFGQVPVRGKGKTGRGSRKS